MGNKKWIMLTIVVAAAVAAVVWSQARTGSRQQETRDSKAAAGIPDAMLGQMKVRISPVSQSAPMAESALPADLAETARAGNTGLVAGKVTYVGGGEGYVIYYSFPNADLQKFSQTFLEEVVGSGRWTALHIATSPGFAFFEIQNAKHEGRVSMTPEGGKISVTVEAVIK